MNTRAQNAAFAMLNDAFNAVPDHLLIPWLYTVVADRLNADQLEELSKEYGRAGHENARIDTWGSREIAEAIYSPESLDHEALASLETMAPLMDDLDGKQSQESVQEAIRIALGMRNAKGPSEYWRTTG